MHNCLNCQSPCDCPSQTVFECSYCSSCNETVDAEAEYEDDYYDDEFIEDEPDILDDGILEEDDPDEDEEFADLDVIVACTRAIDTLDEITQDRVVRWLHAHYVDQAR